MLCAPGPLRGRWTMTLGSDPALLVLGIGPALLALFSSCLVAITEETEEQAALPPGPVVGVAALMITELRWIIFLEG